VELSFDALGTGTHMSAKRLNPDEDAVSEVEGYFLASALVTSSASGNSIVMFEDVSCRVLLFDDPASFSSGPPSRSWLPKVTWTPMNEPGVPSAYYSNECEPAGLVLDKNDVAYLLDRNNVSGWVCSRKFLQMKILFCEQSPELIAPPLF